MLVAARSEIYRNILEKVLLNIKMSVDLAVYNISRYKAHKILTNSMNYIICQLTIELTDL